MKSHELAKKLLELPDLELLAEVAFQGAVDKEFKSVSFNGDTQITPSGIFLKQDAFFNSMRTESPNKEPVIGSYMIYFSDGLVVKPETGKGNLRISIPTVKYLSTGEVRTQEYGSYNHKVHDNHRVYHRYPEANIVLVTNREDYESNNPDLYTGNEKYELRYLEDIDFVKVLTSYDDLTWTSKYTQMTYKEALEYGKNL